MLKPEAWFVLLGNYYYLLAVSVVTAGPQNLKAKVGVWQLGRGRERVRYVSWTMISLGSVILCF